MLSKQRGGEGIVETVLKLTQVGLSVGVFVERRLRVDEIQREIQGEKEKAGGMGTRPGSYTSRPRCVRAEGLTGTETIGKEGLPFSATSHKRGLLGPDKER